MEVSTQMIDSADPSQIDKYAPAVDAPDDSITLRASILKTSPAAGCNKAATVVSVVVFSTVKLLGSGSP